MEPVEVIALVAIGGGLLYVLHQRAAAAAVPPAYVTPPAGSVVSGATGGRQTLNNIAVAVASASGIPGAGAVVAATTKYGPGLSVKLYNVERGGANTIKAGAAIATHAVSSVGGKIASTIGSIF